MLDIGQTRCCDSCQPWRQCLRHFFRAAILQGNDKLPFGKQSHESGDQPYARSTAARAGNGGDGAGCALGFAGVTWQWQEAARARDTALAEKRAKKVQSQQADQARADAEEVKYATEKNILYRSGDSLTDAMRERCRLDVYHPQNAKDFPAVVWFHGGGLTKGSKSIPAALTNRGIIVIAANYRLSPTAKAPEYIEDAAAAVAWTFANVEKYGGSRKRVFVSGHSAGGYLSSMLGLDKRWLKAHEIDADEIAGLVPLSGQAITHFTVRAERGIEGTRPVIDDLAPLYHVRKDAPPILLITGDRNKELLGRYEENAYLWRMLKVVGHKDVELLELQGYDHGGMPEPAFPLLVRFVKDRAKAAAAR